MPTERRMTIDERRTYLSIMQLRYVRANKPERGRLLSDMEHVTDLDRKTLIRLLQTNLERHPRQKQRQRTYGPDVEDALRLISESWDYPCAERLTPDLVWKARHLAKHGELTIGSGLLEQLASISIPTVRRILRHITQDEPKLARPRPSGPNAALRAVPMHVIPWDTRDPGHFEADLVHHCGTETDRQYMHTVQLIDVATGCVFFISQIDCSASGVVRFGDRARGATSYPADSPAPPVHRSVPGSDAPNVQDDAASQRWPDA